MEIPNHRNSIALFCITKYCKLAQNFLVDIYFITQFCTAKIPCCIITIKESNLTLTQSVCYLLHCVYHNLMANAIFRIRGGKHFHGNGKSCLLLLL